MRKMKAWMQKGVVIHDAVKAAQRGWSSSDKSKKVAKSVETSDKPRMTLKKMNLQSANILGVSDYSIYWQSNSPGSDISPFFFNQSSLSLSRAFEPTTPSYTPGFTASTFWSVSFFWSF